MRPAPVGCRSGGASGPAGAPVWARARRRVARRRVLRRLGGRVRLPGRPRRDAGGTRVRRARRLLDQRGGRGRGDRVGAARALRGRHPPARRPPGGRRRAGGGDGGVARRGGFARRGDHRPSLPCRALVLVSPSSLSWQAIGGDGEIPDTPSWTDGGGRAVASGAQRRADGPTRAQRLARRPRPGPAPAHAPAAARRLRRGLAHGTVGSLAAERFGGPLLLLSGSDDAVWPRGRCRGGRGAPGRGRPACPVRRRRAPHPARRATHRRAVDRRHRARRRPRGPGRRATRCHAKVTDFLSAVTAASRTVPVPPRRSRRLDQRQVSGLTVTPVATTSPVRCPRPPRP